MNDVVNDVVNDVANDVVNDTVMILAADVVDGMSWALTVRKEHCRYQ